VRDAGLPRRLHAGPRAGRRKYTLLLVIITPFLTSYPACWRGACCSTRRA
jgi:hypothetical protein